MKPMKEWPLSAVRNLWFEIKRASPWLSIIIILLGSQITWADSSVTVMSGWEHTASSAYEDGWTGSVRGETKLLPEISIGAEYTYHGNMSHSNGQDVSYGDVSGHSILCVVVYEPVWASYRKFRPYLIGGLGWAWWDFEPTQAVKDLGVTVDLGDNWAYKVGGGVSYPLSSSWDFLVEWSFFKCDVPKDAKNSDGSDSILLGDDNKHGEITIGEEETRLTAGVRYKF